MRKQRGRSVESGMYEWKWYDEPSRRPPSSNSFPEGEKLTRCQEMRYTSTLNLAEEKKNTIKNVNEKEITQYIDILP